MPSPNFSNDFLTDQIDPTFQNFPEISLWSWVLADGVRKARMGDPDDLSWLYSEDHDTGSFRWICDHIDVDWEALIEKLKFYWDVIPTEKYPRASKFCGGQGRK